MKPFNEQDLLYIAINRGAKSPETIAKTLGRTAEAIRRKIYEIAVLSSGNGKEPSFRASQTLKRLFSEPEKVFQHKAKETVVNLESPVYYHQKSHIPAMPVGRYLFTFMVNKEMNILVSCTDKVSVERLSESITDQYPQYEFKVDYHVSVLGEVEFVSLHDDLPRIHVEMSRHWKKNLWDLLMDEVNKKCV